MGEQHSQPRQTSWRNRGASSPSGYEVRVEGMGRRYVAADWEEALALANRSFSYSPGAMKVTIAERRSPTTGVDVAALCRLVDGSLARVDYRSRTVDGEAICLVALRGKKVKYLAFAKAADEATAIALGKELLVANPDAESAVVEVPDLEKGWLGKLYREPAGITYMTAAEEADLQAKGVQGKSLLDMVRGSNRFLG